MILFVRNIGYILARYKLAEFNWNIDLRRETKTVSMYGANVIIFEGILAFHNEQIRKLLDMKVHTYISEYWTSFLRRQNIES